ncbi:hypothetical protein P12x_000705 [Tundrisphaera lichenicola]|uniref:hypothetical protein n=1 Tax=Tundrisphaera lichenicola TaxID=2029860 RepID=UPI003EBA8B3A
MKPDDLLDYALGQIEGPRRAEIESEIASDPVLALQADRLAKALHRLLDDPEPIEPPEGLASRTIAFVAERRARRAILDFVPARVPFRWADVAVAAGILMAGLLTLLPAMKSARDKMSQAGCGFNLQQLYSGLANFAARHDHYPSVCDQGRDVPVGAYAIQLSDESLLQDLGALHCPCRGEVLKPDSRPDPKHIDYAYHAGYFHGDSGKTEPITPRLGATIPVLADQPPHDNLGSVLPGNSPNHAGRGQNLLFADGHIRWYATRILSPLDRDMFLNEARQPQPGLWPDDVALIPPLFRVNDHRAN